MRLDNSGSECNLQTGINCRNTALWNGYSFAIARDGSSNDAEQAFQAAENADAWNDWHFRLIRELQEFGKIVVDLIPMYENGTPQESEALLKEWIRRRETIEDLIK